MKKLTFLSILVAAVISFTSCEEDDSAKVDFEITVSGESPNAIVQLTNTSDVADSFEWQFSPGTTVDKTTDANPQITVDKAGEFTITLVAQKGYDKETKTKTVNISGVSAIKSFENVELGTISYEDSIGTFFSSETEMVYKESELTMSIQNLIDFAIVCNIHIGIYNPSEYSSLNNGQHCKFDVNTNNDITVEMFDTMTNDRMLLDLDEPTEIFFITVYFEELPKVVYYQLEDNRFGAIKFKQALEEKIIADIKVQKYAPDVLEE